MTILCAVDPGELIAYLVYERDVQEARKIQSERGLEREREENYIKVTHQAMVLRQEERWWEWRNKGEKQRNFEVAPLLLI